MTWKLLRKSRGFTLIEMIVVLSIIMTLLGFITINLVGSQQSVSLTSTEEVLLSELKQQQLKSMIGDMEDGSTPESYGIHFDSNRYVIFRGSSYSSGNSSNFIANLESNMQFNSPGFDVIFSKLNGEISAPIAIELQDNTNSNLRRINMNTYGVVTEVESL